MQRTLTAYEWLLKGRQQTINCPQVYLDGFNDHMPPIFVGSGTLTLVGSTEVRFDLDARTADSHGSMRALRNAADLDDIKTAMRLRAIDYSGTEWNGGWVRPKLVALNEGFYRLAGESAGLSTVTENMSGASGVELAYLPAPKVPFSTSIRTTAHLDDTEIGWRTSGGRHRFDVLGCAIEVTTQPWSDELWIFANTNMELNHPYLENWLSEPLRALRGQLIYPRLVARNFADGRAFVWVRTAPELRTTMGGCATQLKNQSAAEFWRFYERYLAFVAQHRGPNGAPGFDANLLTQLHEEVIQARYAGSTWVIALCVASAIEGLAKLDPGFAGAPSEYKAGDVDAAKELVAQVPSSGLRAKLLGSLSFYERPAAAKYLARLRDEGKVTKEQLGAWNNVRNKVAHGSLFEPSGGTEEHRQLVSLLELFYRLTCLRIGYL